MSEGNGALPASWELACIGDITVPKVDQVKPEGPITYIDIGSIDNLSKSIEDPKNLSAGEKIPSRARQVVKTGDILVSMTRPNLNAVAPVSADLNGAICSTGFDVLRTIEVEPTLIFNFVRSKSFVDGMTTLVQGALYPAVRPNDIREFRLPLPPLAEQRHIVAKIETLQERSRKAREALADVGPLLGQFRQSLLAAAFRGDLTADWRAKNPDVEPASELLARIRTERRQKWEQAELAKYEAKGKTPPKNWQDKYQEPEPVDDADLPKLPEGWCWASFEECSWEITVGHVGPMKHRYVPDGITMLRSQNVRPLRFDRSNCEYIPLDFDAEIQKSRLYGNEILVVRSGVNVGDCCVYPADEGQANCSDLVITRPLNGMNPFYAAMYIVSPTGKAALRLRRVGNAQPHFNVGSMKKSHFPLAPIDEQTKIVEIVEQSLSGIAGCEAAIPASIADLDQLDQSILAKAFRGELVPQDPQDEPAAVLLERIRRQREAAAQNGKRKRKTKRTSRKKKT